MDLRLAGKIALITGASRGLGFATARQLALEGCHVAINSRNLNKLNESAGKIKNETGVTALLLPGDVTDLSLPGALVKQTVEYYGGLDCLVTNSGGPPPGRFEDLDEATWQQAIELSLMCHVRLIRAALPYLRKSTTPSVLTITSVSVKQPIMNLVLSNSVRAATVGLTKSLALELGGEGIRFNSILPSWTETERVHQLLENRAKTKGTTKEAEIAAQAAESALGRMGTPEEFGNVAAFLLSPASSYLTGVMLSVDGGSYRGIF
jgi:3-oxoacyl-[acyl-carrier protein] reductase